MQKAQFNLGTHEGQGGTTYDGAINHTARLHGANKPVDNAELALKHRKTNILMGTDGNTSRTEAQEKFTQPDAKQLRAVSQSQINEMKQPHFSLAEPTRGQTNNYFVSTSRINNSGARSYNKIVGSSHNIVQNRRLDARSSHFNMGFETKPDAPFVNKPQSAVNGFRPSNDFQRNMALQKQCNIKMGSSQDY
mgnify:CR=1 FL=1